MSQPEVQKISSQTNKPVTLMPSMVVAEYVVAKMDRGIARMRAPRSHHVEARTRAIFSPRRSGVASVF
jgi:hypothetical protein